MPDVDPASQEAWVGELTAPGPAGHAAQEHLFDLLLRATRHQVGRLRHQVPGAGTADLEDLAQQAAADAMIAVLGKLDTFEGRSRFSTWVYKFGVLHAGVAVRRQAWRHREVSLPDTLEPRDRLPTPEALVQAGDLHRAVEVAIMHELTPHQRRVTLALLVDQVPVDVLAARLGTNRNALYKTLHDARQRLRACLLASGHLEEPSERSKP
ncbi:sigma-70 family RNA polymerase sigma factor [Nocardioides sp. AE5]|uniref:RNA polymerase sigma factor n=1 Tax=Nocardioides sp. AE5 TaxID=2962573 RepID=UPI002881E1F5|nr:sigma-70 family RNA polymerase sigma factor [Nocardioides sp. AE5]MDT0203097.1 sigma-70 family RNA polymerase sigma factor [Nocardioides sp. AE5]